MKRLLATCFALFLPLLCLATEPLRVVALHSVLAEFVTEIGGDQVSVTCLIPGGSDPHSYNPAPADIRSLAKADLVLASGFGLEPWLDKLVRNSGTHALMFEASSAIRTPVRSNAAHEGEAHGSRNAHDAHDHGELDPHWWHSLVSAREVAAAVAARLCALQPEKAAFFNAGLASYEARLVRLSAWVDKRLESLPAERRQVVTSHDAFGYLARDYGFRIHPLNGVNPEAEPDAKELAGLIDFIRREKIRSVFADNTENPKLLASMLRESGAVLGGTLFADGLGAAGSPAGTYEGMVRSNIEVLVTGLQEKQ